MLVNAVSTYLFSDSLFAAMSAFLDLDDVLGEAEPAEALVASLMAFARAALQQKLLLLSLFDLFFGYPNLFFLFLLLIMSLDIYVPINNVFDLNDRYNEMVCVPTFLLTLSIFSSHSESSSSVKFFIY